MDPSPDYDVSDEIEFFLRYLTWGLRASKTATDTRRPRTRRSRRASFDRARAPVYSALSSSATSVTDFFASPNSIVVPSP